MPEYKSVAELLEDPSRWCRGAIARDARGNKCHPRDEHAICFCLFGAVCRVYEGEMDIPCEALETLLAPAYPSLGRFNDDPKTTHADVLHLVHSLGL